MILTDLKIVVTRGLESPFHIYILPSLPSVQMGSFPLNPNHLCITCFCPCSQFTLGWGKGIKDRRNPAGLELTPQKRRAWHVGMRSPLRHLFRSAKLVKMTVPKRSAAQQRLAAFPLSPALQNSVQYFKILVALRPLALLPSVPVTALTRFPV